MEVVTYKKGLTEERDQDSKVWRSPPLTNMSKIHLHMEQYSWKINWKLAEDSYTTKTIRKVHT